MKQNEKKPQLNQANSTLQRFKNKLLYLNLHINTHRRVVSAERGKKKLQVAIKLFLSCSNKGSEQEIPELQLLTYSLNTRSAI